MVYGQLVHAPYCCLSSPRLLSLFLPRLLSRAPSRSRHVSLSLPLSQCVRVGTRVGVEMHWLHLWVAMHQRCIAYTCGSRDALPMPTLGQDEEGGQRASMKRAGHTQDEGNHAIIQAMHTE